MSLRDLNCSGRLEHNPEPNPDISGIGVRVLGMPALSTQEED